MTWCSWRAHFERNAARPLPPLRPALPEVPDAWTAALARSLARFQVGESGEGRIAHEIDRATLPGVDADYRAALKRFVAEEGRHARILAGLVQALGGQLLARTWTERLFVHGRRLLGVRAKLLVLLAAEVVGIAFYGALARGLPQGALRRALEELCADEEAHLRFHCDFFRLQARTRAARLLFLAAWWPLVLAAGCVVLLDHRPTLRVLGLSPRRVAGAFVQRAAEAAARAHAPRASSALPATPHA
jgi:hypothetical protein